MQQTRVSLVKIPNFRQARKVSLALAVLLLLVPVVLAQGGYDISWFSMDGGGGVSSGGPYALSGIIGQPDAGVLSGGTYTVTGGFAAGAGPALAPFAICLPSVLRNY